MATGRDQTVAKIEEITERVAGLHGLEVVEVQLLGGGGARMLRIYIDKPAGVTHEDCALISREVGAVLDAEDTIPGTGYTLEVSSPGVERKLSKPQDFERFTGQKAKVVLREPLEGQKRWEGVVQGFTEGRIALEVAPGRTLQVPLDQVEKANLKFEW